MAALQDLRASPTVRWLFPKVYLQGWSSSSGVVRGARHGYGPSEAVGATAVVEFTTAVATYDVHVVTVEAPVEGSMATVCSPKRALVVGLKMST
jgi:hypothetical protein